MSVSDEVKAQFSRLFASRDWRLFKRLAESDFREATRLTKADMQIDLPYQLLARNSRKRLLIGIGSELLLKAAYLKYGFSINRLAKGVEKRPFPVRLQDVDGKDLDPVSTYMMEPLITSLKDVLPNPVTDLERGLRIAQVFRNKEGHAVFPSHRFRSADYRDIENMLSRFYSIAFSERLLVRFSMEPGERALWRIE